jgi:hypothetical protein
MNYVASRRRIEHAVNIMDQSNITRAEEGGQRVIRKKERKLHQGTPVLQRGA